MKLQHTKNGELWECSNNNHRDVSPSFKELFDKAWRRQAERLEINLNKVKS